MRKTEQPSTSKKKKSVFTRQWMRPGTPTSTTVPWAQKYWYTTPQPGPSSPTSLWTGEPTRRQELCGSFREGKGSEHIYIWSQEIMWQPEQTTYLLQRTYGLADLGRDLFRGSGGVLRDRVWKRVSAFTNKLQTRFHRGWETQAFGVNFKKIVRILDLCTSLLWKKLGVRSVDFLWHSQIPCCCFSRW